MAAKFYFGPCQVPKCLRSAESLKKTLYCFITFLVSDYLPQRIVCIAKTSPRLESTIQCLTSLSENGTGAVLSAWQA